MHKQRVDVGGPVWNQGHDGASACESDGAHIILRRRTRQVTLGSHKTMEGWARLGRVRPVLRLGERTYRRPSRHTLLAEACVVVWRSGARTGVWHRSCPDTAGPNWSARGRSRSLEADAWSRPATDTARQRDGLCPAGPGRYSLAAVLDPGRLSSRDGAVWGAAVLAARPGPSTHAAVGPPRAPNPGGCSSWNWCRMCRDGVSTTSESVIWVVAEGARPRSAWSSRYVKIGPAS